jgi:[protein-PII] uridylyltransferase
MERSITDLVRNPMPARIRDRELHDRRHRFYALLSTARDEYAGDIRRGHGGPSASSRYAERVDDLIRDIGWAAHDLHTVPYAVCALGGYGRRLLCLHSDLDLLIVFEGQIGAAEERLVKAVLHPLWDLRLTVGHQIRELSEFEHLDSGNAEFLLALLDARFITGEPRVFEAVWRHLPRPGHPASAGLIDALMMLIEQRHGEFNDTFYQLEPDVKNAPGGLRDVAAARWLRMLSHDDWAEHGRFDERRLYQAEDFLMRVRSILHAESGRDANVLTHPLQERVADILRFGGDTPQQRVEGLMGEYFRHARAVSRLLDWACHESRGGHVQTAPVPAGPGLEQAGDGIRFVDVREAASDPSLWLRAFSTALDQSCGVSDQALTVIQQNAERYGADDFVAAADDRAAILGLFRPRHGLYSRLSEMHDCGLLGRVCPEFDRIHCRVIRDFYHKYTVDEHTLLTIRNLESLLDPPNSPRARFSSLLQELRAPELLALALLFHDVGKWKDEDHAIESTRMAQTMLDRLDVTGDARRTVEFLIEHHLEMSRVAFRRDSEDPHVVRQFADLVRTEEMLKMLSLMTFVDVGAVAPDTLTPWKEELLWRLYVDTYNHLTLSYADELIGKDQAGLSVLMAGRPGDISEAELERFLGGLPRRYLSLFDYRHVRLARDIRPDQVHATLEKKGDVWDLAVVTLDKPFLFSNIAGVLSYFGMDILRGQAMTTPDGLVLDVFQFTDQEGFLLHNAVAPLEIQELLQSVVAGTADITALLGGKERSLLYRRPLRVAPVVYFDNDHSARYSILEVVAPDALGLLYRISRAISKHGCDLDLVLVSTEGRKAIDVFHITKAGGKLSETDQAALAAYLRRTLEGTHEAD